MNLSILLDTNIIIPREDYNIKDENLQSLFKVLNEGDYKLFVHENSYKDIERDNNSERKENTLFKIRMYKTLYSKYDFTLDDNFTSIVNYKNNPNDYVDNSLLYSLYKEEVSFLITEDKGIHNNARKLGIDDYVLSKVDAANFFKESTPLLPYIIKKTTANYLDINDPIFNKLKKDYEEFDSWFKKIHNQRRNCLVYENHDSSLGALLIYKKENEVLTLKEKTLPAINRIKIATMVVTSTGYKIGESFLKWIINYALENNIYELYLTHFVEDEQDALIYLIEEYGFIYEGDNVRGEVVYVKKIKDNFSEEISNSYSYIDLAKKQYPHFYDDINVNKFIVPIKPKFHEKLFLSDSQQTSILDFGPDRANEIEIQKHTIKKAYLSRSSTFMEKGDIVLFYESDKLGISEIGVVEQFYKNISYEKILKYVGKRSVYSKDELKEFGEGANAVLLFIHSKKFNKVDLDKLLSKEIIKAAPQSTQRLSHENYLKLKQLM